MRKNINRRNESWSNSDSTNNQSTVFRDLVPVPTVCHPLSYVLGQVTLDPSI